MQPIQHDFNRVYILHGNGGITMVQARLADYGICSHTVWAPVPPNWRFRFDTYVSLSAMQELLDDLWERYDLKIIDETR